MSFNTALSGLNASQKELGVVGNNIANANTVGFKESRAQFADVYATSAFGSGGTAVGAGVLLSDVAQQFTQGNLEFTQNSLDLAVSGQGFFVMTPQRGSQEFIYTRAGQFGVNADGYVVNSAGQFLQAFPVNEDGSVRSSSLSSAAPLLLPSNAGTPLATDEVQLGLNLPASALPRDPALFDPALPNTYHASTSVTIYDSLGNGHIQTTFYVKYTHPDPDVNNSWAVYAFVDDQPVDIEGGVAGRTVGEGSVIPGGVATGGQQQYGILVFDNAGNLDSVNSTSYTGEEAEGGVLRIAELDLTRYNGAEGLQNTINYVNNNPTQYASPFTVTNLSQNGYTTGRLSGIDISDTGVIRANYTNGQSTAIGKLALATFANVQGLRQLGNTAWAESISSGEAQAGEAGTLSLGLIQSGAVESSNVDLTAQLVKLITAQRNFQANAKAIETNSNVTQTVINIR
jgi:flagellar hook protein FlgE